MNTYETENGRFLIGMIEEQMTCPWDTGHESYFIKGPGFEISPTRTALAAWWRPWNEEIDKEHKPCSACWMTVNEFIVEMFGYFVNGKGHTAFFGPCICGATHHLPDVAKENRQAYSLRDAMSDGPMKLVSVPDSVCDALAAACDAF